MRQVLLSLLRAIVLLPSYTLVLLIRLVKWLIAPPALLLQLLIGTPLALWRVHQPLHPRFDPVREPELPDAAWLSFIDATETLTAAGFVHYDDLRNDELIQGAVLWLRLLAQPEQGNGALIAHIRFVAGAGAQHDFVEFSTQLQDGRVLATNNFDLPYSLPPPAYMARLQLKDVWDPRALYTLHNALFTALGQAADPNPAARAARDPAGLLIDIHRRQIQALIEQGWLRMDRDRHATRLRPWAALVGAWRQAWPLAGLYLRAADRHARRMLASHGIDASAFAGAATAILVDRQSLPDGAAIATAHSGYQVARPLAQRISPRAVLEAVVAELDGGIEGPAHVRELRYTFRGHEDQPQRRIRRWHRFDILVDPVAGQLAVTATDREFEQATTETEWDELIAAIPPASLVLGSWLYDLDRILPIAQAALATGAGAFALDSASLYMDANSATRWQVIAWDHEDRPLHVVVDARSGSIQDESNG
ncbi:MAG: hypothetical protein P9E24_12415 [Candidatus Competibacter sp.]|nr:hypothetical protein [Candidatus Competibacter sp.]MDG4583008.1 hypothetical protein [Candidatus Competibacter sp.]